MRCANCGEWIADIEDDGEEMLCEICSSEDIPDEDYDDYTGDVGTFNNKQGE